MVVVQPLSHVWPFVTPWTAECQALLSSTVSRVCSNSCPLSQQCYLTISSSAVLFPFCLQSFPASRSFPLSWPFASGGQSIGASASVLPMNIQGWYPLGLSNLFSLKFIVAVTQHARYLNSLSPEQRQSQRALLLFLELIAFQGSAPGTCLEAAPRLVRSPVQLWSLEECYRTAGLAPKCQPHFQFTGSCCFMSCWPYMSLFAFFLLVERWEGITLSFWKLKLVESFNWQKTYREMWIKQLRKLTLSIALKKIKLLTAVWHQYHDQHLDIYEQTI